MDNSLKQEFTRRLSQCNRGESIVIMYDIVFVYVEEAKVAQNEKNYEEFKAAVRKAQKVIDTLNGSLNYAYDLSRDLHQLYLYSKNSLAKAIYQNKIDGVLEAERVLRPLYTSFCEVAKADTSEPLMRNTQQVYAGMTYGKSSLNENCFEDNHRGFFA